MEACTNSESGDRNFMIAPIDDDLIVIYLSEINIASDPPVTS